MYESLIQWCKQDINVVKQGGRAPSGEVLPGQTVVVKGLFVNDTKLITDKNGTLYQCRSYAYTIPSVEILYADKILMPGMTTACEIRKLGGYYDGNTGKLALQVVYL